MDEIFTFGFRFSQSLLPQFHLKAILNLWKKAGKETCLISIAVFEEEVDREGCRPMIGIASEFWTVSLSHPIYQSLVSVSRSRSLAYFISHISHAQYSHINQIKEKRAK